MSDKPSLLVVDDEELNRKLLEMILGGEGYAVRGVASGEEALAAAAAQPPDLILLDIMMPGVDGFEVARRLKAATVTRAIPIIMVTSLEDSESRLRALHAGAEDFLSKPVDPAELRVRVRNLLRLKEYSDFLADHNQRLEDQVRQRTAALTQSEARLRGIMESARDAIVVVDSDGGRVVSWNPAAEAIFGYRGDEIIGRGIHDFLPPERFREAARHGMAHFAASGDGAAIGRTMELIARHKDGREFPIELSLAALQIEGRRLATGIVRDISQRKAHEAQIERLNIALRTLSACNVELVHARSEDELLQNVCRHLVDIGGHLLAWVDYCDAPDAAPRFGARCGDEAAWRSHAELAAQPAHAQACPVAIALRTRRTETRNRLQDGAECGCCGSLREAGVAAILALPLLHKGELYGVLTLFSAHAEAFGAAETRLAEELAGDLAFGIATLRTGAERDRGAARLRFAMEQTIAAIALTLEKRDPYTAGHQQRVAELAAAIATEMGLPPAQIEGIHFGALIHDIGKVYVPAEILSRPGRLSDLEFGLIKTHSQVGYDIVKDIPFPWPVAEMVHQHHERVDGSGYPQGLKGEQITLEARILAVADVVEAMSSHRPYRAALGPEAGLAEIERQRGSHFDAAAADACLRLFREQRYRLPG